MPLLADGELAEQALNHASPLDREHKRLVPPESNLQPDRYERQDTDRFA
jgi:hypothetical protein